MFEYSTKRPVGPFRWLAATCFVVYGVVRAAALLLAPAFSWSAFGLSVFFVTIGALQLFVARRESAGHAASPQ